MTALSAGGNGGWDPQDRPDLTCPDNYCGYAGSPDTMPMTDTSRFENALRPAWVYNNPNGGRGMGSNAFLEGVQWGNWNGQMLVGIMGAQQLWRLSIDNSNIASSENRIDGAPHLRYLHLVLNNVQSSA